MTVTHQMFSNHIIAGLLLICAPLNSLQNSPAVGDDRFAAIPANQRQDFKQRLELFVKALKEKQVDQMLDLYDDWAKSLLVKEYGKDDIRKRMTKMFEKTDIDLTPQRVTVGEANIYHVYCSFKMRRKNGDKVEATTESAEVFATIEQGQWRFSAIMVSHMEL